VAVKEQIIRPGIPTSGRVTPASFPFYTTGEDNLRVTSWNAAPGVLISVDGRALNAAGNVVASRWTHAPNTNRSAQSTDITLSGTTILNLTVYASVGAPAIGQTFVKVELIRGTGIAAIVLGTILQGYITSAQALGWPGSPLQTSVDSGGYYRTINGTTPSAGAEVSEVVPTGARWHLLSFAATLQASGVAGTRQPALVLAPTGLAIIVAPQVNKATAGQQGTFNWAPGLPFESQLSLGLNVGGLPLDVALLAGGSCGTSTSGLQVGDQWTQVFYLIREYLEP